MRERVAHRRRRARATAGETTKTRSRISRGRDNQGTKGMRDGLREDNPQLDRCPQHQRQPKAVKDCRDGTLDGELKEMNKSGKNHYSGGRRSIDCGEQGAMECLTPQERRKRKGKTSRRGKGGRKNSEQKIFQTQNRRYDEENKNCLGGELSFVCMRGQMLPCQLIRTSWNMGANRAHAVNDVTNK